MRIVKSPEKKTIKKTKSRKKMGKKIGKITILILIGLITMLILFLVFTQIQLQDDFLPELNGQLYYLKRMGGINILFKSDADLQNEKIVYSHRGKGMDSQGDSNDNIYTYYYDAENKVINFIAMHEGEWSMFALEEGSKVAVLVESDRMQLPKSDFLKKSFEGNLVYQKEGSLFISYEGRTECVKKFYGVYDEKFTGYLPVGFSPEGRYLVYYSRGHLTMFGTFIEALVSSSPRKTYIMDMETGKSMRYVKATHIQWVMTDN